MNIAVRNSIAVAASFLVAAAAHAETFGFGCITYNSAANCSIGEAQLQLSFSQQATSSGYELLFTLTNSGPARSSITDVYFDWTDVFTWSSRSIENSDGVQFDWGAAPGNLPGANNASPSFVVSSGLSADSDSPVQPNGVNPGESVSFRFLTGYANTLLDLYSGDLRLGLHVQGFANGGSESFVNIASPVPEPGALALLVAGLGAIGMAARRRRA